MSYYFAIIGTKDNPLFEHEFGTSKQGGDGIARFREEARHLNQFIVHSSLDVVEEVQWGGGQMYLKTIDRFPPTSASVACFITATNVKFLLLSSPNQLSAPQSLLGGGSSRSSVASSSTTSSSKPSSYNSVSQLPASEDAMKNFFTDVYEVWVKTIMNPFWKLDMPVRSPVFRARVAAAAKKYL